MTSLPDDDEWVDVEELPTILEAQPLLDRPTLPGPQVAEQL